MFIRTTDYTLVNLDYIVTVFVRKAPSISSCPWHVVAVLTVNEPGNTYIDDGDRYLEISSFKKQEQAEEFLELLFLWMKDKKKAAIDSWELREEMITLNKE